MQPDVSSSLMWFFIQDGSHYWSMSFFLCMLLSVNAADKSKPHVSVSDFALSPLLTHSCTHVYLLLQRWIQQSTDGVTRGERNLIPRAFAATPPLHTHSCNSYTHSPSPFCIPLSLSGWMLLEPAFSSSSLNRHTCPLSLHKQTQTHTSQFYQSVS